MTRSEVSVPAMGLIQSLRCGLHGQRRLKMALFNTGALFLFGGAVCSLVASLVHPRFASALIICMVVAFTLGLILIGLGIVEDLPMVAYREGDGSHQVHVVDLDDATAIYVRRATVSTSAKRAPRAS